MIHGMGILLVCLLITLPLKAGAEGIPLNGNERRYDWYVSQYGTGPDALINCGPACAVMAAKWYDEAFGGTVQEARDSNPALKGKWWYYRHIQSYLIQNGTDVSHAYHALQSDFKRILDENKIIIANIHSRDITYRDDETDIGRFYEGCFGHFIILKGYREADGTDYFEVYDPYTLESFYADGSPKGRDRIFPADEVIGSVRDWGDGEYLIVNPPR